jgi:hypothetical protein
MFFLFFEVVCTNEAPSKDEHEAEFTETIEETLWSRSKSGTIGKTKMPRIHEHD